MEKKSLEDLIEPARTVRARVLPSYNERISETYKTQLEIISSLIKEAEKKSKLNFKYVTKSLEPAVISMVLQTLEDKGYRVTCCVGYCIVSFAELS